LATTIPAARKIDFFKKSLLSFIITLPCSPQIFVFLYEVLMVS